MHSEYPWLLINIFFFIYKIYFLNKKNEFFFSAEGRTAKPLPGSAKTFWFFFSAHQLALFHKPGPNRSLYQLTGPFKDEKDTH